MDNGTFGKVPALAVLVAGLVGVALATAVLGDAGRAALRYERAGIAAGEWWRLVSAHVVHLGWSHTALNLVALLLVAGLFGPFMRALEWALVSAAAALAIDAGLYLIDPEIDWYVGLSGVLHGLFAAGTLALYRREARFALVLGTALAIKLAVELVAGPIAATAALTGGEVVTQAHLYGSLGGVAAHAGFRVIVARRRGSI